MPTHLSKFEEESNYAMRRLLGAVELSLRKLDKNWKRIFRRSGREARVEHFRLRDVGSGFGRVEKYGSAELRIAVDPDKVSWMLLLKTEFQDDEIGPCSWKRGRRSITEKSLVHLLGLRHDIFCKVVHRRARFKTRKKDEFDGIASEILRTALDEFFVVTA